MAKRDIFLFLSAALILAAGLFPVRVLQIDDLRADRGVFVRSIKTGDRFTLTYRHSVERCLIWDFFRIDGEHRIVLDETMFASSNTGLPSVLTGQERFTRGEKASRISNIGRILPAIEIWVDRRYDNTLEFDSQKVLLAALAGDTLLRLRIRRIALAEYGYRGMHSFLTNDPRP
ncbi:MAG: DUF1850 domain-containing protein [Proteobacteria bacterium]|nr:DUF1850 domain-containing protein [Pseudomonadota bacterium]